jgi:hypothetical protein
MFLLAACPGPSAGGGTSVDRGTGGGGTGGARATGGAGGTTTTTGSGGGTGPTGGTAAGGASAPGGSGGDPSAPDAPVAGGATGGAYATGGAGPTGGAGATGGMSGSGGAPAAASDAAPSVATDGGRPWLMPCPKDWTREQCCMHYCGCMMKNCAAQTPANCQATCVATTTWKLDCRVEQCFESLNPNYPMDGPSHCKHAVEQPLKCQNLQP